MQHPDATAMVTGHNGRGLKQDRKTESAPCVLGLLVDRVEQPDRRAARIDPGIDSQ